MQHPTRQMKVIESMESEMVYSGNIDEQQYNEWVQKVNNM